MSDSYDDYEAKMALAEYAWEKRVVKTEHDRAVELGKAYERGWNAALAQREWVGLTDEEIQDLSYLSQKIDEGNAAWFDRWGFARAIEAKLKEKNKW
jgi:hypothetical protein